MSRLHIELCDPAHTLRPRQVICVEISADDRGVASWRSAGWLTVLNCGYQLVLFLVMALVIGLLQRVRGAGTGGGGRRRRAGSGPAGAASPRTSPGPPALWRWAP